MDFNRISHRYFSKGGPRGFLGFYLAFLVVGLFYLLAFPHGALVMLINKHSVPELDWPMRFLTDVGLGSTIAVMGILLSLFRLRYALMALFNLAIVGIFTGALKNIFFHGFLRPLSYFGPDEFYRVVTTAEPNYFNSFPSGHTMAIFGFLSLVTCFTEKKWVGVISFFVALAVGVSRIYLCQHFFIDVYFASVFGLLSTAITLWGSNQIPNFNKGEVFQKPIYRISFK